MSIWSFSTKAKRKRYFSACCLQVVVNLQQEYPHCPTLDPGGPTQPIPTPSPTPLEPDPAGATLPAPHPAPARPPTPTSYHPHPFPHSLRPLSCSGCLNATKLWVSSVTYSSRVEVTVSAPSHPLLFLLVPISFSTEQWTLRAPATWSVYYSVVLPSSPASFHTHRERSYGRCPLVTPANKSFIIMPRAFSFFSCLLSRVSVWVEHVCVCVCGNVRLSAL